MWACGAPLSFLLVSELRKDTDWTWFISVFLQNLENDQVGTLERIKLATHKGTAAPPRGFGGHHCQHWIQAGTKSCHLKRC